MNAFPRMVVFGALSAVVGLVIGCGGSNDSGGGAPGAPAATDPPAAGDANAANVNTAIAAAQTSDGQAIPQAASANGACPQVLVLLGFWSCPTLGQTCSYAASGVQHSCACDRTDGEGQTPSWVCDQ